MSGVRASGRGPIDALSGGGQIAVCVAFEPLSPPETLVLHGPSVIVSVGMVSALCAAPVRTGAAVVAPPDFGVVEGDGYGLVWGHAPEIPGMPPRPSDPAAADDLEVVRTENLRATPNGERIGQLEPGTRLRALSIRGDWREVEVEGWVWTRSLQVVDRNGYDLVVSASDGENLRDRPGGDVRGVFVEGALLLERERVPGWIRVTRRAWIWGASVRPLGPGPDGAGPGESDSAGRGLGPADPGPGDRGPGDPGSGDAGSGDSGAGEPVTVALGSALGSAPASAADAGPTPTGAPEDGTAASPSPVAPPALGESGTVQAPTELRAAPQAPPTGRFEAGTEMTLLEVQGSWARVRVEGWVPLETLAGDGSGSDGEAAVAVTPRRVADEPTRWQGRRVVWTLEFVSLERADERRPDFAPGTPWLLMRWTGADDPSFVYVAVSEAQAAELGGLAPLSRVTVSGRIRSGAARWTRSPVLELDSWRIESSR
jgi:hypothetical protein